MRSTVFALLATTACLAGCGRKGARASEFDSATNAALTASAGPSGSSTAAPISRVSSFDIGHGLDSANALVGGIGGQFYPDDSVVVTVRVDHAPAGASVSARLITHGRTVDSAATAAPTPGADSSAIAGVRFGNSPRNGWAAGPYQVEVFLNGVSQGIKEFTISPNPAAPAPKSKPARGKRGGAISA